MDELINKPTKSFGIRWMEYKQRVLSSISNYHVFIDHLSHVTEDTSYIIGYSLYVEYFMALLAPAGVPGLKIYGGSNWTMV